MERLRVRDEKPSDGWNVGEGLATAGRNVWLAGLGLVATVNEEGREVFSNLVSEGRRLETRERRAFRSAVNRASDRLGERFDTLRSKAQEGVQNVMAATLHRFGVPTHGDIAELEARVEQLGAQVRKAQQDN